LETAPEADLAEQSVGSASDLETRIDAPPRVAGKPGETMPALRALMAEAGVSAVMTVDTNEPGAADARGAGVGMWVPFHAAVVVRAGKAWDEGAVEAALREALGPELSAGGLGLDWVAANGPSGRVASLGEVRPLAVAVRGELLLVSDDSGMMQAMLARMGGASAAPVQATLLEGFDHDAVSGGFERVAGLLDRPGAGGGVRRVQTGDADAEAPGFFSGNLAGLARTFAAMKSERVVERRDGAVMRQTVTYAWQR
jgi:hypothetical protein